MAHLTSQREVGRISRNPAGLYCFLGRSRAAQINQLSRPIRPPIQNIINIICLESLFILLFSPNPGSVEHVPMVGSGTAPVNFQLHQAPALSLSIYLPQAKLPPPTTMAVPFENLYHLRKVAEVPSPPHNSFPEKREREKREKERKKGKEKKIARC